jgi:hypothetical protein
VWNPPVRLRPESCDISMTFFLLCCCCCYHPSPDPSAENFPDADRNGMSKEIEPKVRFSGWTCTVNTDLVGLLIHLIRGSPKYTIGTPTNSVAGGPHPRNLLERDWSYLLVAAACSTQARVLRFLVTLVTIYRVVHSSLFSALFLPLFSFPSIFTGFFPPFSI